MKKFYNLILILCIICISIFTGSAHINETIYNDTSQYILSDSIISEFVIIDSTQYKIDSLTNTLLDEVTSYIKLHHQNCPDIIPESFVKYGLEHDIDICFMMSQAKVETVFGKYGIGRNTSKKSIFGVMSKKYKTYDEAVNHYITVLNKYYLKTKTEQDLLKKFTTSSGARYAADLHYEKKLRTTYNNICNSTNIKELQNQITKLDI